MLRKLIWMTTLFLLIGILVSCGGSKNAYSSKAKKGCGCPGKNGW